MDEEYMMLIIYNVPRIQVTAMQQAAKVCGLELSAWLRIVVENELARGFKSGLYRGLYGKVN